MLQITLSQSDSGTLLQLHGRIDATTAGAFDEKAAEAAAGQPRALLIDFTDLEYISSAGLRSILKLAKLTQGRKIQMRCFGMQKGVFEVFRISGFSSIIKITDTREQAVDSIS